MTDKQKEPKKTKKTESSRTTRKPPAARKPAADSASKTAAKTVKSVKKTEKPVVATKPKKAAATARTKTARTAVKSTSRRTSKTSAAVDADRPVAAPPPTTEADMSSRSDDDSLLLEWQTPINRPKRVGPRENRVVHAPRPTVDNRGQDERLNIPAWPELSDEAIAPPPPARQMSAPPDWSVQDRQARRSAEPMDEGIKAPAAKAPTFDQHAKAQAGSSTQEPALDENGQPIKKKRRRRRRGRHRGQNGQVADDKDQSQGQAGQQPSAGVPDRQSRPSPEPRPQDRDSGRESKADRDGRRHSTHEQRHGSVQGRGRNQQRDQRRKDHRNGRELHGPEQDVFDSVEDISAQVPVDDEIMEVTPEEDTWVEEESTPITRPSDKTGRLMLINVAEGDECRIAILHQNRLEELFIERASAESHVGNIYKGRITNVEPSIQAAFVDFGLPKNGFLHISDLQPQYFPGGMRSVEEVGRKTPRRERPPIQKCLRRGQEIIVQIIKEGIGTKGPTLTTYISIPGRYLVMMPGMNRLGVSRRIEDEDARRKMRSILDELELPKDMGFILRTAGMDRTKRELQQDLLYLQRLWKVVAQRIKNEKAPCELYRESDLVIRTIRDVFSADFSRIIVDDPKTADKVRGFLSIATPRSIAPVDLYSGRRPLFHEYKLEQEIDRINSRYVPLPSGGSLVIESTEALVAIDVNSGRFREHDDAEETAYRINIEAAEEIARQLRLRDLGGLILCDFVDMRMEKHRRGVERALREALKKHKERAKCLRMSQFGIIEMTRQRMRPSIKRSIYRDCPHCRGSGLIKNAESMTLDIMRLLQLATHHDQVDTVEVRVAPEVEFQLQNRKRGIIHQLESQSGRRIIIRTDENLGPDQFSFECLDNRGGVIRMDGLPEGPRQNMEVRSKRRSSGQYDPRGYENPRETLEDVFD